MPYAGWTPQRPCRRATPERSDGRRERGHGVADRGDGNPVAGLGPGSYTALWTRYYAGWCDKIEGSVVPTYPLQGLNYIQQEPWGVAGLMVPCNGPMMGMGQKALPALVAGGAEAGEALVRVDQQSRGLHAFAGRYELRDGRIWHHLEAATFPTWAGTVQVREFELTDMSLTLVPAAAADGRPDAYLTSGIHPPLALGNGLTG